MSNQPLTLSEFSELLENTEFPEPQSNPILPLFLDIFAGFRVEASKIAILAQDENVANENQSAAVAAKKTYSQIALLYNKMLTDFGLGEIVPELPNYSKDLEIPTFETPVSEVE